VGIFFSFRSVGDKQWTSGAKEAQFGMTVEYKHTCVLKYEIVSVRHQTWRRANVILYPTNLTNRQSEIKIFTILGYYVAQIGSHLPTFQYNLSVPQSRVKQSGKNDAWRMSPKCPETSVNNYSSTLCNISEGRRCYLHRGGSL